MERTDELKERIRQQPLNDRLKESRRRIGDMCAKGRCPKMTIPVQHDDDDFYINTTLADAQATIAALQDERDGWVRSREHYYQLWMRATDERDEMRKERDEFESQLTQRTAELEAANKLIYKKNCELGRAETINNDLQAELERVRADNKALDKWRADVTVALQRPEGAFFVDVPQHIKDLVKERDDLRTLLLALPKVEGEIRVEEGKVISVEPVRGADPPLWWRRTIATFEDGLLAKHYSKLLQHRQGMEG